MDIEDSIKRIKQQKATQAAEEKRRVQEQQKEDYKRFQERQMEARERQRICEMLLEESGVLDLLQQLKRKRLDGREKKVALVMRYDTDGLNVTLAWGKQFMVENNSITSVEVTEGLLNKRVYDVRDYSEIKVIITDRGNITVKGKEEYSLHQPNNEAIADAIAQAFLNPRKWGPSKDWRNPNPPDWTSYR